MKTAAGGFHLELPTRMIRETLNTLTIEHCFEVFTWIEGKAQRLVPENKDPDRSNSMRNLALLRGLNDLLKRVSKPTKVGFLLVYNSLSVPYSLYAKGVSSIFVGSTGILRKVGRT